MDFDSNSLSIGKKRCRTEIFATIISLIQGGKSQKEILEKANLNVRQLERYLKELHRRGLAEVEHVDGRKICGVTSEGRRFLKRYSKLINFLE